MALQVEHSRSLTCDSGLTALAAAYPWDFNESYRGF